MGGKYLNTGTSTSVFFKFIIKACIVASTKLRKDY